MVYGVSSGALAKLTQRKHSSPADPRLGIHALVPHRETFRSWRAIPRSSQMRTCCACTVALRKDAFGQPQ